MCYIGFLEKARDIIFKSLPPSGANWRKQNSKWSNRFILALKSKFPQLDVEKVKFFFLGRSNKFFLHWSFGNFPSRVKVVYTLTGISLSKNGNFFVPSLFEPFFFFYLLFFSS